MALRLYFIFIFCNFRKCGQVFFVSIASNPVLNAGRSGKNARLKAAGIDSVSPLACVFPLFWVLSSQPLPFNALLHMRYGSC